MGSATHMHISGVGRAARALSGRVRDAVSEERLAKVLYAVAQMGMDVAKAGYSKAEYPGTNDVSVSIERGEGGKTYLVATGAHVLFIEFGSGVNIAPTNPLAAGLGYHPGGFSTGKIRPSGWWLYVGERGSAPDANVKPVEDHDKDGNVTKTYANKWWTQGNGSANAMYEASKEMRDQLAEQVRRIWGGR